MLDRGFLEFMDDPIDWFEEAARLTRLHAAHLSGEGPSTEQDAMAEQPTGSRTVPTQAAASPSPVNVIQLDSRRPS